MQNPILEHLENPFMLDDMPHLDFKPSLESYEKTKKLVKELFGGNKIEPKPLPKAPEKVAVNQIWTVKTSYVDAKGRTCSFPILYTVIINEGPYEMFNAEDKLLVRVKPLCPHIEMRTTYGESPNLVVMDGSVIGYPFMMDQFDHPICTDILDTYVGEYDISSHVQPTEIDIEEQFPYYSHIDIMEYRKLTLNNAWYLTNSSWSYLEED